MREEGWQERPDSRRNRWPRQRRSIFAGPVRCSSYGRYDPWSLWWRSVVADRASLEWSLRDASAHSDAPSSPPPPHRRSFATRRVHRLLARPAVTGVVPVPVYVSSRRCRQCVADGRPRRVPSSPSYSSLRSIVREKETKRNKKKRDTVRCAPFGRIGWLVTSQQ